MPQEVHEMTGRRTTTPGRSMQLAVMAAPSSSVADAVAEARRRHDASGTSMLGTDIAPRLRMQPTTA
jgi:hypothetical protein